MNKKEEIISLRNGTNLSFVNIGKIFNLSGERVRQIYYNIKSHKIIEVNKLKIFTRRKKLFLGLPIDPINVKNGGRDYFHEMIRIRDLHSCTKCGKRWIPGTRRFDIHHNDESKDGKSREKGILKWNKENMDKLVTLCHACHMSLDETREHMRNRLSTV